MITKELHNLVNIDINGHRLPVSILKRVLQELEHGVNTLSIDISRASEDALEDTYVLTPGYIPELEIVSRH